MKSRKKSQKLFDPDSIASSLASAIHRDYGSASLLFWQNPYQSEIVPLLRENTLKKYYSKKDTETQEKQSHDACLLFLKINEHMRGFDYAGLDLPVIPPAIRYPQDYSKRDLILLRARAFIHYVLQSPVVDTKEWFDHCRSSNGVSAGVSFSDTSVEAKFTFPLTTTADTVDLFFSYLKYDREFRSAIEDLNDASCDRSQLKIVGYSRATTVDKDATRKRFIAIEPTVNMFFQQGLMSMMYSRLRDFGLDVYKAQGLHKQLACQASITRSLATIDFSSASDCMSSNLLEWLLPFDWYRQLDRVRTGFVQIDSALHQCNMFATMGNATTFPLETLLFWALAYGTYHTSSTKSNSLLPCREMFGECRVYGDDCIVPTAIADTFMDICKSVGFIVNRDKSFFGSEYFRESCGGDYFHGYDARPFYIRPPHSDRQSSLEPWLYIIMNRTLKKYITYFGSLSYIYNKQLLVNCAKLFNRYGLKVKLVPDWYPDDAGLKVGPDRHRLREYGFRFSKVAVDEHGCYSFLYMKFVYRKELAINEKLRYAIALKGPRYRKVDFVSSLLETSDVDFVVSEGFEPLKWFGLSDMTETPQERKIRKIGGYVVARGYSSHWEL